MSGCRYSCSENRTGQSIPDYADISGIGVIIGYTATAGICVLILTIYYIFAHQPELDPFRSEHEIAQRTIFHKPHPIDSMILSFVRRLGKVSGATTSYDTKKRARLEKALLKCVLTMSDLQLLTGLSILISGFSQLKCGITAYHWQILVYLAWFCSLTHLSCLTFLRNYLYNHPGERLWRLVGMGALIIMLIVALLPTGNFGVNTDPAEYAICSFHHLGPAPSDRASLDGTYGVSNFSYASMIFSVLFMALGFLSRIVRLHRNLSITGITKCRVYLSERARRILRKKHRRLEERFATVSKVRTWFLRLFYYRPLLALFLVLRAVLDLWSSMVLEVWWLIASFAWGVYNLVPSLDADSAKPESNRNWTFGQIAPMIMLLAPILSVTEFIFEKPTPTITAINQAQQNETVDQPPIPSRTETMELVAAPQPLSPESLHDNPDQDFYQEAWFRSVILFLFCGVISSTIQILFVTPFPVSSAGYSPNFRKGRQLVFLIPNTSVITWFPFVFVLGLMNVILFSMLLKGVGLESSFLGFLLWLATFAFYFVLSLLMETGYLIGVCVFGGLYFVFSIIDIERATHRP